MVRKIPEDASEKRVIDNIATYGWHCIGILAEDDLPGYSFTIGNYHTTGHPEFIIVGLATDVAHDLLHLAVTGTKDGTIADLAAPTDAILEGYSCIFVEVPKAAYREHVGYARWYYEGDDFPLYQIVWPSMGGQYSWDADASAAYRARQPVLGTPPGRA